MFALFVGVGPKPTTSIIEGRTLHAYLLILKLVLSDDVALDSDGLRGVDVVTSDHADLNSS